MIATINAWAEVLDGIPLDRLNEYYVRASRAKRGGFAVNSLDIRDMWNRLSDNRKMDEHFPESERGTWY